MTLTITVDDITSPATTHTAYRYPSTGVGAGLWGVSWLQGRLLTRDEAITAIRIAAFAQGAGEGSLGQLCTWATELGLDAAEAWRLVTQNAAVPA